MDAHSLRYHHRRSPGLGELAEAEILGDASLQTMTLRNGVEAVEPFELHPTFMSYKYEVFEHLQLLCLDIWLHTHSVTTTDVP
jgi:hypothetical protein